MRYRAEIDGMRAIAVLPVVFFHAGISVFRGGYVGVDIFFVISGYLITSILLTEIENGEFSLKRFYDRRARRILPVLILVMVASSPVGLVLMTAEELVLFARSIIAVLFFASNFLFWRESGYFSAEAEQKPLLHTWSLSIEEQFYLFFPIAILISIGVFRRSGLIFVLLIASTISFLICLWALQNQPTANFYLSPTRAWELLVGALAACIVSFFGVRRSNILSAFGLGLIVFSVFTFDHQTPFPGPSTLAPVLGAAMIVIFAGPGTLTQRVLSNRVLVGFGLISYSIYLWHQPLFAFARMASFEPLATRTTLTVLIFTLLLSIASWRWVERPFRHTIRPLLTYSVFGGFALLLLMFGALVGAQKVSDLTRIQSAVQSLVFPQDVLDRRKLIDQALETSEVPHFGPCFLTLAAPARLEVPLSCAKNKSIVVIGDSHARDVYGLLANAVLALGETSEISIISLHKGGCRPNVSSKPRCLEHYRWVNEVIEDNDLEPAAVVYVQAARELLTDERLNAQKVQQLLNWLESMSTDGVSVFWFGPRGSIGLSREEVSSLCFSNQSGNMDEKQSFVEAREKALRVDRALAELQHSRGSVLYVSQVDLLTLNWTDSLTDCSRLFWSDEDHLSDAGESKFGSKYLEVLGDL